MQLEVMCLDCEEQWDPDYEPSHCICDDTAEDAWLVFIKDTNGKWVKYTQKSIDDRYETRDNGAN